MGAHLARDLTTNDPEKQKQELSGGVTVDNSAAEMHTTIYAIAESPKNPNVIWVGTDDGNVQVTRDGGKTWKNVVGEHPRACRRTRGSPTSTPGTSTRARPTSPSTRTPSAT